MIDSSEVAACFFYTFGLFVNPRVVNLKTSMTVPERGPFESFLPFVAFRSRPSALASADHRDPASGTRVAGARTIGRNGLAGRPERGFRARELFLDDARARGAAF